MSNVNEHKFDFSLPMYPHQTVGDNGMPCDLTMDGQPLTGVSSLFVKAGVDGFTNVSLEFHAGCAVQFIGHLNATVIQERGLDGELALANIYDQAMEDTEALLDPDSGANTYERKSEFVLRVLGLLMERMPPR